MKESFYEKQIDEVLKEVERILKEGGTTQWLTIQIEMGLEQAPYISYEMKNKVVRF